MVVKEEVVPVLVVDAPQGTDPVAMTRSLGIPVVGELTNKTGPDDFKRFLLWASIIQESRPRELVYRRRRQRNGRE